MLKDPWRVHSGVFSQKTFANPTLHPPPSTKRLRLELLRLATTPVPASGSAQSTTRSRCRYVSNFGSSIRVPDLFKECRGVGWHLAERIMPDTYIHTYIYIYIFNFCVIIFNYILYIHMYLCMYVRMYVGCRWQWQARLPNWGQMTTPGESFIPSHCFASCKLCASEASHKGVKSVV